MRSETSWILCHAEFCLFIYLMIFFFFFFFLKHNKNYDKVSIQSERRKKNYFFGSVNSDSKTTTTAAVVVVDTIYFGIIWIIIFFIEFFFLLLLLLHLPNQTHNYNFRNNIIYIFIIYHHWYKFAAFNIIYLYIYISIINMRCLERSKKKWEKKFQNSCLSLSPLLVIKKTKNKKLFRQVKWLYFRQFLLLLIANLKLTTESALINSNF